MIVHTFFAQLQMAISVGGVLSGVNPFEYNAGSPVTLFLFQVCLILAMCNLLHLIFARIRQPKVISEVIAGVILGPTVFGQIQNYTNTVFPKSSIPGLSLTANLGIILFMFFLGLEVDLQFIKKNIKTAVTIGLATLAVPFGCGCLISIPLFHNYANKDPNGRTIKFTVFMIFIAVSMSVTAFPVLCRILNELRLIKDRAGIIVLGAGIINDILGWILLALSIILSNSESNPVNTVYILLCTFGWFLIYFYPVRYILKWALIKTHELDRSRPSPFATMCILFIMFVSAYFTDIIGVHAIFGAFIAGLIVPRDNNYVIKLAERMEDIPNIILIPIYFAVAGLNVDLTLLNEGKDWGFVFACIGIAIASKVISGCIVAKLNGLFCRESLAVGILMSCKGIVEIVVLTVGLNSGIINQKIYGIFILMALVSTFVTTPLTMIAYPDHYRKEINDIINKKDVESETSSIQSLSTVPITASKNKLNTYKDLKVFQISEIVTIINNSEEISACLEMLNYFTLGNNQHNPVSVPLNNINLTKNSNSSSSKVFPRFKRLTKSLTHSTEDSISTLTVIEENHCIFEQCLPLKAIHLRLLTERTTDLLQSSTLYNDDPHFTANSDSLLQIFFMFARLAKVPFSSEVIFSTMKEKAININTLSLIESSLVFFPLKGASYQSKDSSVLNDDRYKSFDHIFSHILGSNELPSNYFSQLTELKSNILFLISNNSDRLNVDRFKTKNFYLLLQNPNITSSDLLAIYLFLLINYRGRKNQYNIKTSIFINEKNSHFIDNLCSVFEDQSWFEISSIDIILINPNVKNESDISCECFIKCVLENIRLTEKEDMLEEATFIIAERYFVGGNPFSDEVKDIILEGANKRFNILITHHYSSLNNKFLG